MEPIITPGKKLVFSLLAIVFFFALLEGTLALIGFKPQVATIDPTAGFSGNYSLFVEDEAADGHVDMVTARNRLEFFNAQRFPKIKRPGTYRIFSLGGSTAYGHPYTDPTSFSGWMREYLGALAPERTWEVINAGGISYGSAREVHLMEELVRYQPDLFVIYCGHNEFLEKRIQTKLPQTPPGLQSLTQLAWRSRSAALLLNAFAPVRKLEHSEQAAQAVLDNDPVTMLDNSLGPTAYKRDEAGRTAAFEQFRANLERMADLAQQAGARVIFVNPASNLRDVSPFKSEHLKDLSEPEKHRWLELYSKARDEFNRSEFTNALATLAAAETLDSLPANLHFIRGRVLEKLGRFPEAKAAYERAREEDVCPLRAPAAIGRIVTEVAAERKTGFVDFAAFVDAHSDHGIPGGSLFLDHVHPTVEGYRLMAIEILKDMQKDGVVRLDWKPEIVQRATDTVLGKVDARAQSFALMNLCKTLGWAGKREEAYRAGAQAIQLGPDLPEVQYQTGLAAQLSGRTNEAVTCYRKAIDLKPDHGAAHCALGVVLEDQGELEPALSEFRLALEFGKAKDAARNRRNVQSVLRKLNGRE